MNLTKSNANFSAPEKLCTWEHELCGEGRRQEQDQGVWVTPCLKAGSPCCVRFSQLAHHWAVATTHRPVPYTSGLPIRPRGAGETPSLWPAPPWCPPCPTVPLGLPAALKAGLSSRLKTVLQHQVPEQRTQVPPQALGGGLCCAPLTHDCLAPICELCSPRSTCSSAGYPKEGWGTLGIQAEKEGRASRLR